MNKFLISFLIAICFLNNALAQTASNIARVDVAGGSEVRINQIDTSAFPKVTIFATVLKDGTPVEGLAAKDFRVREDEVDQEPLTVVAQLSSLNAVVTIDTSGSIKKDLPQVQTAAANFLDSLDANDKFDVISFSREVKTISSDGNKAQAKQSIQQTVARGDTALFDAIYQSIAALKDRKGRKAVVLLTDGVDDDGTGKQLSKHSLDEALELAKTVNVPVFTIGLGPQKDVATLGKIATASGGKYFDAITPEQLAAIYEQIGKEITGQYNIYYSSNLPADGSLHRVNLSYSGLQGIKEYESPKIAASSSTAPAPAMNQDSSIVIKDATKTAATKVISSQPGLHIAGVLTEGGEATETNKIIVTNKPASSFDKAKQVADCYSSKTHCSFVVPTGSYQITVFKGDASATVDVDVDAAVAKNVWVNLNAGKLRVVGIPAPGAPATEMNRVIVETKSNTAFEKSKRVSECYSTELCEAIVPAGNYVVEAKKGEAFVQQDVTIEAGKSHELKLDLQASILNVAASLTPGGAAVVMNKIIVTRPAASAFSKEERITECYNEDKCSFVLNAGKYNLAVTYGSADVTETVELAVGQQIDKLVVLQSGVVKVGMFDASGAVLEMQKAVVKTAVNSALETAKVIDNCYGNEICEFKLPAGKYIIEATHSSLVKSKEIEVKAGEMVNLELR